MKAVGSRRLRGLLVWALLTSEPWLHAPLQADTASVEELAPRVRINDGLTARAVRLSVAGARRRLQDPACRALLAEFWSLSGRPIQAELEDQGQTVDAFLARLLFYDGSEERVCASQRILAATEPWSRVVLICARSFTRIHKRNAVETELVVIHEMLHTLGLGEDPPSSSEINAQVEAHCGSGR